MNNPVISVARTLLSRNIAFCIYRLPGDISCHLAIDAAYLPHPGTQVFQMSPFSGKSDSNEVFWEVIKPEFINESLLKKIIAAPENEDPFPNLPRETTRAEYFSRLKSYLDIIRSGKLKKAVLSRVLYADKPDEFDPLENFLAISHDYPNTLTYLLLHPGAGIWMGAAPELLLKKRGKDLYTMALAGTQFRRYDGKYRWRAKEMEEHQMLWNHIEGVFSGNGCELVKRDGPVTVESGSVAHLKTDYHFRETSGTNIQKLLKELHPTPAVGGLPVNEGVDCILNHEGYDRKYYSGIIGQTDFSEQVDLYVNLRCMQIGKSNIAVYVGGGITASSDAQEEWDETEWKSRTMLDKLKLVKELK